jgi:hypothetical protein
MKKNENIRDQKYKNRKKIKKNIVANKKLNSKMTIYTSIRHYQLE